MQGGRSADAEADLGAAARGVAGANGAAVLSGDVADDGEPETRSRCRSGVVGAMETIEDPFDVGVVDAGAVVAYDDPAVRECQFDRLVNLWALPSRLVTARSSRALPVYVSRLAVAIWRPSLG